MKDNRLKTSYENYEAFDHIAGSSFGTWSDRETAHAMIEFLNGSINTHPRYYELMSELAQCPDDELCDFLSDLDTEISEVFWDTDDYLYAAFRDNEYTILPAIESAIEDHQNDNQIGEELPEVDSTHHCGETFVVVNERGNTSLYRFVDTVTGWQELWAVV